MLGIGDRMNYKKYESGEKICSREEYFVFQEAKILSLIDDGKISLARKIVMENLSIYPNEVRFLKILSILNVRQKNYLEAINILEGIDGDFDHHLLDLLYVKVHDQQKMKEVYQKYYSGAFFSDQDVYQYNDAQFLDYQVHLYFKKIYDNCFVLDWGKLVYICKQLYSYDNRLAVGHIEVHHQDKKEVNKGIFDPAISIYTLFRQVQRYINLNMDRGLFDGTMFDRYCFYYPNCGRNRKDKETNYFEVVSLVNTSHIITMYPMSSQGYRYYDLCYLDDINSKSLVKVKNGLERFQGRYGNH